MGDMRKGVNPTVSVFCIDVLCNGVQLDIRSSFIYGALNEREKKEQSAVGPQLRVTQEISSIVMTSAFAIKPLLIMLFSVPNHATTGQSNFD
jgi:hypothetical protein